MQQRHRCCAGRDASTSCPAVPAAAVACAGPTAQRSCESQHGRQQQQQQQQLQHYAGSDEHPRLQQHRQQRHTRPLRLGAAGPPLPLLLLLSLGLCGLTLPPLQQAAAQHVDTLRRACLQRIQLSLINTFDLYLSGFTGKVALIDVSTHPNLGDTMLWHGAKRILFHWERTPDVLCAFTPSVTQNATFPRCPSPVQLLTMLANNTANSLILWHPAGNWGDIGLKFHAMRTKYIQALDEALATNPLFARHNSTFIQLPQSVYYSHSDVAAEDKKIFTSLKRLQFVLYTHSMDSFEMLQDNLALSSERAIAHHAPDMAFALGPIQSLYPHAFDIVILFKIDHESAETHLTEQSPYERVIQQATAALQGLKNPSGQPVTFKVTDWRLELGKDRAQAMFADLSDVRLNTAIRIISQGKVVVTNRLHGAVAATLIGRPNFWFEGESLGLQNFAKLSNTLRRARDSAPTMCREDNLRSYEVTGANEEEAFRSALRQAADLLDSLDDLI